MVETRHLRKHDCAQLPENPVLVAQSECFPTSKMTLARPEFLTCLEFAVEQRIRDLMFSVADHCSKCQAAIVALDRTLISDGQPVARKVHRFGSDISPDGDIRARNPPPECFLPPLIVVDRVSYAGHQRKLTRVDQQEQKV